MPETAPNQNAPPRSGRAFVQRIPLSVISIPQIVADFNDNPKAFLSTDPTRYRLRRRNSAGAPSSSTANVPGSGIVVVASFRSLFATSW